MRVDVKNRQFSISTSSILFVLYLVTSILVYAGSGDGMGTIQLGVSVLTIFIYYQNEKTYQALPILAFTFFALVLLVLSGQMRARGFNAPIKHVLKFVHILYAFTAFIFIRYIASETERRIFVIAMLLVTVVICARSVVLVLTSGNAYAIRYASRYGFESDVAGFNQVYAIPFYIVIVSFVLVNLKKKKPIYVLLLLGALLIYLLFVGISLFTTALIMSAAGLVLLFFFTMFRNNPTKLFRVVLTLIILAALVILIFPYQIMDILTRVTKGMNYVIRDRLLYVAEQILRVPSGISYSYERREELASYSLQTFRQYPLFGVGYGGYGYGVIGCHQEWIDMLGVFGIVGSAVVFAILTYMFLVVYRDLESRKEKDLYIILVVMFIVLGFLNPCLSDPLMLALFVIVPNVKYLYGKDGGKLWETI